MPSLLERLSPTRIFLELPSEFAPWIEWLGDADALGVARRRYEPLSGRKLWGVCCEAVVSDAGYAGVVTWLCDAGGRLYTLPDVMPGAPERARAAYRAGVELGEVVLSHAELARRGVVLSEGRVSADGRLGRGKSVHAASAGSASWDAPPLADLWGPLEAQAEARRALLCFEGVAVGRSGDAVVMDTGGRLVRVLGGLARYRVGGLPLRLVAQARPNQPRTVRALAFGPAGDGFHLPETWGGRVNLGLDELKQAQVDGAALPFMEWAPPADPLEPLRIRLNRGVVGGRVAIAAGGHAARREAARLRGRLMPTASALVDELQRTAEEVPRDLRGARLPGAPQQLAQAWLAAALFEREATQHRVRRAWAPGPA